MPIIRSLGLRASMYLVAAVLTLGLAMLAAFAYHNLGDVQRRATYIETSRVSQLEAASAMELNVTRVSLQLRHMMLARDPAERRAALDDIVAKRQALDALLGQLTAAADDDQARSRLADLPRLYKAFWQEGEANLQLIADSRTDEAFDFLVRRTIPARNAVLAVLDDTRRAQQAGLQADTRRLVSDARRTLVLLVGMAVAITVVLLGLFAYIGRRLHQRVEQTRAVAQRVRDGDLSTEVRDGANDEFSPLLAAMRDMQQALARIVSSVRSNAEDVASTSSQIAQGNNDLAQRTEEQAGTLSHTASTMQQLGVNVQQNAGNARQANQLAQGASAVALRGGEVVTQVVSTMEGINHSSRRIADIIGVIDGIAFQTNILALNAAVEAARAGEQGRGFAVVAGEVRNLAQRSAAAAKEIKDLIDDSVRRVSEGSGLVHRAGQTMEEIVHSIGQVNTIVSQISTASDEQSAGVIQVGDSVGHMDQATQQNAALVEESAAVAEALRRKAADLLQTVSVFRLSGVRA
ncbi:methyl-accepting chemotaxis protein [Hydrogenophaga defluvii]|uniref:Methyl-accepting chemotaxis protein n=1 Tax=Hydrogenophaga defluvii TaxID=249410 RepID=A0ABW2S811_9BURK